MLHCRIVAFKVVIAQVWNFCQGGIRRGGEDRKQMQKQYKKITYFSNCLRQILLYENNSNETFAYDNHSSIYIHIYMHRVREKDKSLERHRN